MAYRTWLRQEVIHTRNAPHPLQVLLSLNCNWADGPRQGPSTHGHLHTRFESCNAGGLVLSPADLTPSIPHRQNTVRWMRYPGFGSSRGNGDQAMSGQPGGMPRVGAGREWCHVGTRVQFIGGLECLLSQQLCRCGTYLAPCVLMPSFHWPVRHLQLVNDERSKSRVL